MSDFEQFPRNNKREETPNIMKSIRGSLSGRKKMLGLLAGYGLSFWSGNQEVSAETIESPLKATEISLPETNLEMEEGDISFEEAEEAFAKEKEKPSIRIDSDFELGKAVQSKEVHEQMVNRLKEAIEAWPEELKLKLADGTLYLEVESSCSPEEIIGSIDVGNGEKVDNNKDLSIKRAERGVETIEEVADLLGMELTVVRKKPFEDGINPDRPERYVEVHVKENLPGFEDMRIFEGLHGKVEKIYVDASQSMEGKVGGLYEALDQVGLIDQRTKLQFGSERNEITKEYIVSSRRDVEIFDKNIRHERKFGDKEATFENALGLIENLRLVSPQEREVMQKNILAYMTDEYLTVDETSLHNMELQMVARNKEIVFFIQNRETGKVERLTISEMRELYNAHQKNGEKLTIDTNNMKIEGGKVDIVI